MGVLLLNGDSGVNGYREGKEMASFDHLDRIQQSAAPAPDLSHAVAETWGPGGSPGAKVENVNAFLTINHLLCRGARGIDGFLAKRKGETFDESHPNWRACF